MRVLLRIFYICLIISLSGVSVTIAQEVDNLTLMTEEYPPFNYSENGQLKGFAVDLMVLMLKKAGSDLGRDDIRIMPWSNAYNQTLKRDNSVLFAMSRTPSRENLFKWVGPIAVNRVSLIAPKDKNIRIDAIDAARKYKIGVIRDDSGEALLIQTGIGPDAIEQVASAPSLARMLAANRIDLVSYSDISFNRVLKDLGFSPGDYEVAFVLDEVPAFYAFNKNISDKVIEKLQSVLDNLKKPGENGGKSVHQQVLDKYLQ